MSAALLLAAALATQAQAAWRIPRTVAAEPWPEHLGSHRARVRVATPSEAVRVRLEWRRPDDSPERKATLILNAATGAEIRNVLRIRVNREWADLVFQPDRAPADYFVYFLPFDPQPRKTGLERKAVYRAPEDTARPEWARRYGPRWRELPRAGVIEIEARSAFDRFDPMEVIALGSEVEALRAAHPSEPLLFFPEDRAHPIRMTRFLPQRWIESGPKAEFLGKALRNEFYVFQIGVYAQSGVAPATTPLAARFEDLRGPKGSAIPAAAFRCFNFGGNDDRGHTFRKEVTVAAGHVAPLWFGVGIPLEAAPGAYRGRLWIGESPVNLAFTVAPDFLRDGGVDQPARLARLKWLDSTIGLDGRITPPYTPLERAGNTLSCLGRQVTIGRTGLPAGVRANGIEVLDGPVALEIHGPSGPLAWERSQMRFTGSTGAEIRWEAENARPGLVLRIVARMEFDGGMGFDATLQAGEAAELPDITLRIPFAKDRAPYVAGMGLNGGNRPQRWQWRWTGQPQRWRDQGSNLEYFTWLGDVKAGLYCRLKSPLQDWRNGDEGGVRIEEDSRGGVWFQAATGPRKLAAGETLRLNFRLLPTPLKPPDPARWKTRYAHSYRPIDEIAASGATVLNIHHGTLPNLWINYPFLDLASLIPYTEEAHRRGLKLKIYYTVRELTNRLPELWALRSLGSEIYRVGGTQGHGMPHLDTWLQEHLVDGYAPGWIWRVPTGEVDAALRIPLNSRWNNFYLEGLKWLLENARIDGLYLDEVGYTREMMQRVRRVMEAARPGSMIDLHGNRDWWSCNSPVGYYMEHLPYVDRIWFGEAFNPDSPPDFYLVEMSGLPFGLPGELLQNPNPWRGMLYGITARAFYDADPTGIWKLWDEFGIDSAEMLGWWDRNCPVRTDKTDVLATVYKRSGRSLIALAGWARQPVKVRLQVDWRALGLDPAEVRLRAPAVSKFQPEMEFGPGDEIPVEPGRGWLLTVGR